MTDVDESLLLLRGVVGPLMLAHGLGNVNGFTGAGYGITGTAGFVEVMATAARTGHQGNGPWVFNDGWAYVAVLGAAGAALAFTGPGRYSLDRALGTERVGPVWGLTALAFGLGSAVAALAARRPPTPVPMPADPAAAATPAAT